MALINTFNLVIGLSLLVLLESVTAFETKIVNGTQAMEGEFPFVVSLRRSSSGRHACGGSLINRGWVLTAGHCVSRAKPTNINIQYGSSELNPKSANVVNVSKIFTHEGYDPSNKYIHDIALLKLQTPITLDKEAVRAVRLPENQLFTPGNTSAILIGWGLNAVSLRHSSNNKHFCGGSIIDPFWILTAAHCLTFIKHPKELRVQFGSLKLNPETQKLIKVKDIIKHEGYNPTVAIHDICLLKLARPLEMDFSVKAVKLPTSSENIEMTETVILTGWGLNETLGTLQSQLQQVELHLIPLSECQKQLNAFLHKTTLCAGLSTEKKGQCSGDSGSPLLYNNTQIGLVSWSLKPCASLPGVFTNIAHYTDWIYGKLG